MRFRITMWAMVGFLVAAGWAVYALASFPSPITPAQPLVWNLALLTQPIVLASFHFHFPASVYLVFVSNAVSYAMLGLIVESLRRQVSHVAATPDHASSGFLLFLNPVTVLYWHDPPCPAQGS